MKENGVFEVLLPGTELAEEVRTTFRTRMERLYSGWSDNYDRQYDDHSFLFVLRGEHSGELMATCRIVFKQYNDKRYLTPMEMGDASKYAIPCEPGQVVCEGGMVSFVSRDAILKLMYNTLSWLVENNVTHIYTTYDTSNSLIKRLYTRTLKFPMVEGHVATFSDFKSKKTGEAVDWQVVGGSLKDKAQEVQLELQSKDPTLSYVAGQYSRLEDWAA